MFVSFQIEAIDYAGVAVITLIYLFMKSRRPKNRKIEETVVN
jgi:hypothetical protein